MFQRLDNSGEPPAALKNAELERVAGGIRVSYSLPPQGDLLYVEAEVELKGGRREEGQVFLLQEKLADRRVWGYLRVSN